jgi:hypothetical protein
MKTTSIVDWFNPHNLEHLQAYKDLNKTGVWPKAFWDKIAEIDHLEMTTGWQVAIACKIADAFVKEKLP